MLAELLMESVFSTGHGAPDTPRSSQNLSSRW
jgi:hypothetical protein